MRGKWHLLTEQDETAALAALDASAGQTSDSTEQPVPAAPVAALGSSQECAESSADESKENFGDWAAQMTNENFLQCGTLGRARQWCPGPSVDDFCVVIRIPLQAIHQWIEDTHQEIISAKKLHRNESLRLSFDLVLEALGCSHLELEDLLGETDVAAHLQRYLDRKLTEHLETRPTISIQCLERGS